ncbi:TPA: hypothetical protein SIA39_004154 [Aeromonas sobria]|nr:hypothetical protein [Aeromonas sobria]
MNKLNVMLIAYAGASYVTSFTLTVLIVFGAPTIVAQIVSAFMFIVCNAEVYWYFSSDDTKQWYKRHANRLLRRGASDE